MRTMNRLEQPFRGASTLQEQINRVFGEMVGRTGEESNLTPWAPAVDIYETENELVVKADLPDVNPQDLDIRVENNILTIRGPQLLAGQLRKLRRHQGRLSRWRADAKHPEDRGSKAEADQGQCGNTSRESKRTSTKNSGGRPRRSLKETRTEHEVARGLATSSALSISVAAAFRVWRSPRFRSGLDGAGCLTFQEFGVGSEAERFYHVGLHSF